MNPLLRLIFLGCLLQPAASFAQNYCQPIHTSGGLFGDYINAFTMGAIANPGSGFTGYPGYTDYTNQGPNFITSLAPGSTYTATITSGTDATDNSYAIWVDLDQDLVFESDERLAFAPASGPGPAVITTLEVTIPVNARRGYTGLRVLCTGFGIIGDACDSYVSGDTEDYTVIIDDGAPCIPVYSYGSASGDYITDFVLEGVTNQATGGDSYTSYGELGLIISLTPGNTYFPVITSGTFDPSPGTYEYLSIWIDLDQNGAFDTNEKLATGTTDSPFQSITPSLAIPADALTGYTRMRVMCVYNTDPTDACGSYDFGETEDYTVIIDNGAPCIPVYTYGTSGNDFIDGFQFNTINNVGSGAEDGWAYSDYRYNGPNYITSVAPGATYSATITSGPSGIGNSYTIWADLDHDLTYEPDELLAQIPANDLGVTTLVDVTIPADAASGYTSVRVMCVYDNFPTDPCGTYEYGETEDYTLVIDDGAPCIPVYTYGTSAGDFIDGVQLGGAQNTGTGGAFGPAYHNYPSPAISLILGATDTLRITGGANGGNAYTAWIDYNNDNDFADAGEYLGWIGIADPYSTDELVFTVPPGTVPGIKRMRVRCALFILGDACLTTLSGETEDYTVLIHDGSTCIPLYGAQDSQGHYVSDVQLGSIAWTQTAAPGSGYTGAMHIGTHLQQGFTSTMTVFGGSAPSGYLSAWVDWANDGFDPGDVIGSYPVGTAFAQINLDVTPPGWFYGYARMRVAHTDASVGPCDPSAFGSAVDFALSVGRAGWPCLPLQGYGTQLGDGFTDLTIEGVAHAAQTEFPYYEWSSSTPYHYDGGGSVTISFTAGSYAPETYRLSMDMNDNGNFFDTNEEPLIYTSAFAGESITMIYQLPPNCIPGQHFVRLRANDDANFPLADPCDDQLYGQIFDWVVVVEDPNGPCIPFMSDWTTDGDYIDGVQLGTIQNTGTGGTFGAAYQDYTALSTNLLVGQLDTLTITGGAWAGDSYSAWIDYNNDNDFDDAGESLGWIGITDPFGTNELPFIVPSGTTLGTKRMRIRCAIAGMSNACLDQTYGETEDYTVSINGSTGVAAATTLDFLLLPTADGVQVVNDAAWIGSSYTLFDATGRTMTTGRITADRTDVPMGSFARGAYTIQLINDGQPSAKRFVW